MTTYQLAARPWQALRRSRKLPTVSGLIAALPGKRAGLIAAIDGGAIAQYFPRTICNHLRTIASSVMIDLHPEKDFPGNVQLRLSSLWRFNSQTAPGKI